MQNATAHPGYNNVTFANDIGVIILRSDANTSRNPPALLPAASLSLERAQLTVAGFGTTEAQTLSRVLKCVQARLNLCRSSTRRLQRVCACAACHLADSCPGACCSGC